MDQTVNHKYKIIRPKRKRTKRCNNKIHCNECNKNRTPLDKSHQICHVCYKAKGLKTSGNKIIDDFIRHTQINYVKEEGKMEFVPHDQFINIEFIAEGGFSKIYKATWIDGPVNYKYGICERNNTVVLKKLNNSGTRERNSTVVLKKLNNSKNITSKELNEV